MDILSFALGAVVGGFLTGLGGWLWNRTERGAEALYQQGRMRWHKRLAQKLMRRVDSRHAAASIRVHTMDAEGNPVTKFADIDAIDGQAERGAKRRRRTIFGDNDPPSESN